ncbi:peptidase S8/S53 domain-containing protein [Blakeslea trispora]|nr:peptidase S8/S53 domain-containing protein [Blakeslea trispora]
MKAIITWSLMMLATLSVAEQPIHSATHIIKLKSAMAVDSAHNFILAHHKAYTLSRKKHNIADHHQRRSFPAPENIDFLSVDKNFTLIAGKFPDHSFVKYLHQLQDIEYVEQNHIYQTQVEHDGLEKRQALKTEVAANWGLARISQRQKLNGTLQYTFDEQAGQDVHVYVLDTGVDIKHQDFEGRAIYEANFVDNEDDIDLNGHGTHVASKAVGRNFGVAKKATVHSVKVLDKDGDGMLSNIIKGVYHVVETATPGKAVINLSLNGPKSYALDQVLSRVVLDHQIPVFVAAGNSGSDACSFSPSSNKNVFSVGASNTNDQAASFSNDGRCVEVYAPGSDIESAYIGGITKKLDGTSMASPHVTGIAASLLSRKSFATVNDLYNEIISSATENVLSFHHNVSTNYNRLAYLTPL